ncbi:MAG: hypothetical protein ABI760_16840 [Ferruginibacter sp.]
MNKLILTAFLTVCSILLFAQNNILVLKKRGRSIQYFTKDSYLSFQLKNGEWFKGIIIKVTTDSIYLNKELIRYSLLRTDTVHFSGFDFSIKEIFALPKKGVQIDYIGGRFQITKSGGHVHWYWVKGGWIFRAGAIGYAVLNVLNGLIDKNLAFSGSKLGIAAGLFLGGVILKKTYKLTIPIGKKYQLETINLSN